MALWQVDFFVLPKRSLAKINNLKLSNENTFDDAPFWQVENISPFFFDGISEFLPLAKSWGDYLRLYGDENSNRVDVVFEDNLVISVSFRIDFTSDYEFILGELIEYCILNELIILDENLSALPLNFEVIKSVIENSPQVKKYRTLLDQ